MSHGDGVFRGVEEDHKALCKLTVVMVVGSVGVHS